MIPPFSTTKATFLGFLLQLVLLVAAGGLPSLQAQTNEPASGPRQGLGRSGVVTYKSKDLREWEGPFVVFTVPDGIWANPRHGVWAPEVHEYQGKFYLFATLHNNDAILSTPPQVWRTNHLRGSIAAASDSPAGPFQVLKPSGPH